MSITSCINTAFNKNNSSLKTTQSSNTKKSITEKNKHNKLFCPETQAMQGHIYKSISTSLGLGALGFEAGELATHNTVMGLPVSSNEKYLVLCGMALGGLAAYWSLTNSIHFFQGNHKKNKTLLQAIEYFYHTENIQEAKDLLKTMSEPTKHILITKYREKLAEDESKKLIIKTHAREENKKALLNAAL